MHLSFTSKAARFLAISILFQLTANCMLKKDIDDFSTLNIAATNVGVGQWVKACPGAAGLAGHEEMVVTRKLEGSQLELQWQAENKKFVLSSSDLSEVSINNSWQILSGSSCHSGAENPVPLPIGTREIGIHSLGFGTLQGALTPNMVGADPEDKQFCPACAAPEEKGYGPKIDVWVDGKKYSGRLKIREATSMGYQKKSFSLNFSANDAPLINGRKDEKVILNGSYNDPSYMRQLIAYDTVRAMGGYAPQVSFAVMNVTGEFRAQGEINGAPPGGQSLYQLISDWETEIKSINKDAHIYKADADCGQWPCPGAMWNKESDGSNDAEIGGLIADHCNGNSRFNRNDFFRWVYINHFLFNRDSITKNYIIFNRGNEWFFFNWDMDAVYGYMPDGAIYADFDQRKNPMNKPYGRMFNGTHATACTERFEGDYLNAYRNARIKLTGDAINQKFRNHAILGKLRPYANADLQSWKRWNGQNFDGHFNDMMNRMLRVTSIDVP